MLAGAQPELSAQPRGRGKALTRVCLCWAWLCSLTRWAVLGPPVTLQHTAQAAAAVCPSSVAASRAGAEQAAGSLLLLPGHLPSSLPRWDLKGRQHICTPTPATPREHTESCRGWLMASQSDLSKSLSAQSQFLNKSALNYIDL